MFETSTITAGIGLMAITSACGAPISNGLANRAVGAEAMVGSVSGAPTASEDRRVNQRFRTLDEYLAWLRETQGPVDGSWYEEIQPGVYQLRTGNLRVLGPEGDETPRAKTFSRAELKKQFGFVR